MNIYGMKTLIKRLFMARLNHGWHLPQEFLGAPGIGKSQAVEQVAAELSEQLGEPVRVVTMMLSALDQPDVAGYMIPELVEEAVRCPETGDLSKETRKVTVTTFARSPLMPAGDAPRYGILFLDEVRQAPIDVEKAVARFVNDRVVGNSTLPDKWIIILAANRAKDRSGVNKPMAMSQNRRGTIEVTADVDSWVSWAIKNQINYRTISYAKAFPQSVFSNTVAKEEGPQCTPRSLVKTNYLLEASASAEDKAKDPTALGVGLRLVRKEHDAELAGHQVERPIIELEAAGIGSVEFHGFARIDFQVIKFGTGRLDIFPFAR